MKLKKKKIKLLSLEGKSIPKAQTPQIGGAGLPPTNPLADCPYSHNSACYSCVKDLQPE
ncbi:hypothetical protein [Pseudoalteromonas peptidolytica]|uniref:Class I lanthipeptide n=1 Tax=Pseudoalteromonas peptidolytica F12-50-A1 TaxID=1315280 RepID=A0A8I0MU71_9GAMM|nr:hypothetical protein [Pseudoalteromonas peptidolytica]MBE0345831.1 hypothetical protein [Pseudoalteromonas peptidolytica F12-50-A1]GEK09990.1 hypothetical protein PPE03_22390 [Pseudoalteromonas peptidolytica]